MNPRQGRRQALLMGIGCVLGLLLVPGSMWFYKLWIGFALGFLVATTLDVVRPVENQAQPSDDCAGGSGGTERLIGQGLVALLFASVALFGLAPKMIAEDQEAELLRDVELTSAVVFRQSMLEEVPIRPEDLKQIQALLRTSRVYYPNREGGSRAFVLDLETRSGRLRYQADLPDHHPDDLRLVFLRHYSHSYILVPGLAAELELGGYLDRRPGDENCNNRGRYAENDRATQVTAGGEPCESGY